MGKLFVEVLDPLSTKYKILQERLKPGQLSTSGFLAPDEDLRSVIMRDNQTLKTLKITHEQIANRLEGLIVKAIKEWDVGREEEIIIENAFKIGAKYYQVKQFCPFDSKCPYASKNFVIENLKTRHKIIFSELIIHLIRDHHFFEGNVRYRLDPSEVVQLLQLNPRN